jgi:hypothetical protein
MKGQVVISGLLFFNYIKENDMINLSIKKLFRRCLLIAVIGLATGCASVKQMPSSLVVIQERSLGVKEIVVEVKASPIPPVVTPALEVQTKDLVLETPATNSKLVEYISERFKVSEKIAADIVKFATQHAHENFPKRNDILAIIAVESHYNARALHRGCYGLMQIERKSHMKKLDGRSLFNPNVNIEIGSDVLFQYFELLKGNKKAAILSFNSGIGNFLKKRYRMEYYRKYSVELQRISDM